MLPDKGLELFIATIVIMSANDEEWHMPGHTLKSADEFADGMAASRKLPVVARKRENPLFLRPPEVRRFYPEHGLILMMVLSTFGVAMLTLAG